MSRDSSPSIVAMVTFGAFGLLVAAAIAAPAHALAQQAEAAGARPVTPVVDPGAQPSSKVPTDVARATVRQAANLAPKRRPVPAPPKPKPKPKPQPKVSYGPWRSALCSWYDEPQPLAGGGYLTPNAMIVAHKKLPFGTRIQFSYHGRSCIAVVKDRGPYVAGREFDLGPGTAKALRFDGLGYVSYRLVR